MSPYVERILEGIRQRKNPPQLLLELCTYYLNDEPIGNQDTTLFRSERQHKEIARAIQSRLKEPIADENNAVIYALAALKDYLLTHEFNRKDTFAELLNAFFSVYLNQLFEFIFSAEQKYKLKLFNHFIAQDDIWAEMAANRQQSQIKFDSADVTGLSYNERIAMLAQVANSPSNNPQMNALFLRLYALHKQECIETGNDMLASMKGLIDDMFTLPQLEYPLSPRP